MDFAFTSLPPDLRNAVRGDIGKKMPEELLLMSIGEVQDDVNREIRRHKKSLGALSSVHSSVRSGIERLSERVGSTSRDPLEIMDSTYKAATEGLTRGMRINLIATLEVRGVSQANAEKVAQEIIAKL